ncbi:hypothetical protein TRVL_08047 [Trypanosoma vivax]|nr:hypothetical protein TRVL_08047 [Trypanosoma vivax]
MDELLVQVVCGSPLEKHHRLRDMAPEFTILCAQTPNEEDRIALLIKRFRTCTETSCAQTMKYLLQTCIETSLPPDEVEHLVEKLVDFSKEHPTWVDTIQWVCAFVHYYCTDEFTVSLFSEFDVPSVAVRAIRENPQKSQLVLAACALLSHFNLYPIGDGISQLSRALSMHTADPLVCKMACRALAEFTSYVVGAPDRFVAANKEFLEAEGVGVLECVLRDQIGNGETTKYVARITANVTSSGVPSSLGPESKVILYLVEALERYSDSEQLCSHILRVFSNFPCSPYIDMNTIALLFKSTESENLVLEIIYFLCSVAMKVKVQKQHIDSTGCVSRVLEVMQKYPTNSSVQEYACSLLSYLSFDSEAITSTITDGDGIVLVLKAMQNFPSNENLLVAACAALSGLTFNNVQGQRVIVAEKGVACILDAMRFGKSARLQENGCLALGTMCWNSDLKADVVRLGGVHMIMRALEDHYTSVGLVKNACRALAQVAFNCEGYRDEMCAKGVIPLIIRGMAHHPTYDRVQMHGCVALSYLSWNNESNSTLIISSDGCKIIIDAMRNHAHNAEVQEHASRALANIGGARSEDLAPAIELVVSAMRRHAQVTEVQEEACRAIVTLSLSSSAYKDKLFELRAAECVMTAMRNFPNHQVVQQEACNALAHLAYEHANLNKAVTELGGVEVLLRAMKAFPNVPKVQLNACGGLSALAFDNTIAQRQIYDLEGVGCVIRAMGNSERLRMLELGCSVLGTLAWNSEIKESVAVVAVPEILKSMRVHQDSPLLQKSTCRAISQFAFNSESNRKLLAESGAVPLIVTAMRSYVDSEKLLVHGIKALTYLCWENSQVSEAIIMEGIEDVLQNVFDSYSPSVRVYCEAAHLHRVLFRKCTGSPNAHARVYSPPVFSPVPMSQTPVPGGAQTNTTVMLSPPAHDTSDLSQFYTLPQEISREETCAARNRQNREQASLASHNQQQQQQTSQRNRRCNKGQQHHNVEKTNDVANRRQRNRRRGGNSHFGRPGENQESQGGPEQHTVSRPHDTRCTLSSHKAIASSTPLSPDDLWDDPHPDTFHGNRQLGNISWQQVELTLQCVQQQTTTTARGNRGNGRRGKRRNNVPGRAREMGPQDVAKNNN